MGREVAVLADGYKSAGRHSVQWNAKGFKGQELFYRLRVGDGIVRTKKMAGW